jgi:hypothetical protein
LSLARPMRLPSGNDSRSGRRLVSGGSRTRSVESSKLSYPPGVTCLEVGDANVAAALYSSQPGVACAEFSS